jgi:hypothetical protein
MVQSQDSLKNNTIAWRTRRFNGASLNSRQRFSGPNSDQFALGRKGSSKNPAKIVQKLVENGGNWRIFDGQSAISPSSESTAVDCNTPVRQTLHSRSPAPALGRLPDGSKVERHSSRAATRANRWATRFFFLLLLLLLVILVVIVIVILILIFLVV